VREDKLTGDWVWERLCPRVYDVEVREKVGLDETDVERAIFEHEQLSTLSGRRKKELNDRRRYETLERLYATVRQEPKNQDETDWWIAGEVAAKASKLPALIGRQSISQRAVHDWMKRTGRLKD
jgi:hypothetical protein